MKFTKTIRSLKGEEIQKTNPSQSEIDRLPKINNPNDPKGEKIPDRSKLGKETMSDVILNCLSAHKCEDRKEGFYINSIAQWVLAGDEKSELKDKLKKILLDILDDSILRIVETKDKDGKVIGSEQKGWYAGWIISQVMQEMGITVEE